LLVLPNTPSEKRMTWVRANSVKLFFYQEMAWSVPLEEKNVLKLIHLQCDFLQPSQQNCKRTVPNGWVLVLPPKHGGDLCNCFTTILKELEIGRKANMSQFQFLFRSTSATIQSRYLTGKSLRRLCTFLNQSCTLASQASGSFSVETIQTHKSQHLLKNF